MVIWNGACMCASNQLGQSKEMTQQWWLYLCILTKSLSLTLAFWLLPWWLHQEALVILKILQVLRSVSILAATHTHCVLLDGFIALQIADFTDASGFLRSLLLFPSFLFAGMCPCSWFLPFCPPPTFRHLQSPAGGLLWPLLSIP